MSGMTRRERLMATLRGRPVDRPAVNFYEISTLAPNADDPDEFNVCNHPSWRPLLKLAEDETDLICMSSAGRSPAHPSCRSEFLSVKTYMENGSRFTRTTVKVAGRELTSLDRRDPEVNTIWNLEHLLKGPEDLEAYLELPDEFFAFEPDLAPLEKAEELVADRGIVMVDTGDPICEAAQLFSMEDYLVVAMTERSLFTRLLDKLSAPLYEFSRKVSAGFPEHLWRIYGPEYAGEPYMSPELFDLYVGRYTKPIIEAIHDHGGYARLHMHGSIRSALPTIAEMGADGLDPIEPPPLGDVDLAYVRREFGKQMVLFGNLESRDIENMPTEQFTEVVSRSLREGTSGSGRGFVLMPSSCPYGREIGDLVLANYQAMVRLAKEFTG